MASEMFTDPAASDDKALRERVEELARQVQEELHIFRCNGPDLQPDSKMSAYDLIKNCKALPSDLLCKYSVDDDSLEAYIRQQEGLRSYCLLGRPSSDTVSDKEILSAHDFLYGHE